MATTLHAIFRERVSELLAERGWTQQILAERAGLAPQYISNIMNGHRNPAFQTLEKIAIALGVRPYELIK